MKDFLNTPVGSWIKVFLSALLGFVLTNIMNGVDIFSMDWKSLVAGALSSVLPVIINWLNPNDARYGKK